MVEDGYWMVSWMIEDGYWIVGGWLWMVIGWFVGWFVGWLLDVFVFVFFSSTQTPHNLAPRRETSDWLLDVGRFRPRRQAPLSAIMPAVAAGLPQASRRAQRRREEGGGREDRVRGWAGVDEEVRLVSFFL